MRENFSTGMYHRYHRVTGAVMDFFRCALWVDRFRWGKRPVRNREPVGPTTLNSEKDPTMQHAA
jgi:hypothetical protein